DDDEVEAPARAQDRDLLNDCGAPGTADNVANEKEAHSALSDKNGLVLRHDCIQALVMRLIRQRRDFANPVSDSDRMNCLGRPQPRQAAVVVARAISDAMAPSVE